MLVPSLTFVATANSVVYTGAKPVFVDIEGLDTPFLSLADAAAKCTGKTKAVILVHFAGYLVDRDAWQQFARQRGLHLIEDAAHAAGVQEVGSIGEAAAFSFYGNKNMTTAEGGAVMARNFAVLEKVRQMRQHGMTTGTFQRLSSRQASYDVTMLGFNYRMDELRAALGLVQLQHLPEWNAKRKALTEHYLDLLYERCPGVLAPFRKYQGSPSSNHIMPIILPEKTARQAVMDKLRDRGIQTTIHYPPVHSFSFYRKNYPTALLPMTEEFSRRELTLPLHPKLEPGHIQKVVRALSEALSQ